MADSKTRIPSINEPVNILLMAVDESKFEALNEDTDSTR